MYIYNHKAISVLLLDWLSIIHTHRHLPLHLSLTRLGVCEVPRRQEQSVSKRFPNVKYRSSVPPLNPLTGSASLGRCKYRKKIWNYNVFLGNIHGLHYYWCWLFVLRSCRFGHADNENVEVMYDMYGMYGMYSSSYNIYFLYTHI